MGKMIEELSAADSFGEMALIDGDVSQRHRARETKCEVAPINESAFLHLVHHMPIFALTIMHNLADRLRRANERR